MDTGRARDAEFVEDRLVGAVLHRAHQGKGDGLAQGRVAFLQGDAGRLALNIGTSPFTRVTFGLTREM